MRFLQRFFILALKPFECLTKDIPERAKEMVIGICFSLIFVMEIFKKKTFPVHFALDQNARCEIGCCLLFIIIIMSIREGTLATKRCGPLAYLWVICGIIIILVSFIHPVGSGFRGLSILMAVGFPCLYLVWHSRGDYDRLYGLMAKAFVYTGGVYFAFCVVFVPFYTAYYYSGYKGLTDNVNFLGMVCTVVICLALYLILMEEKGCKLYLTIGAISCMYLSMAGSRTSTLATIAATVLFVAFYLKWEMMRDDGETHMYGRRRRIVKLAAILLIFVGAFLIGNPIMDYCVQEYIGVPTASVREDTRWNMPVASAGQTVDDTSVAPGGTAESAPTPQVDPESDGFESLDRFSSGRITIWKNYIETWNLLGHDANKRLHIKELGTREWAHNTFLEMTYRTGLLNGAIFLAIEILAVIYAIMLLMQRRYREPYHFIVSCSAVIFFIYANLEISVFPFYAPHVFLFFMAVAPLFFDRDIRFRKDNQ